MRRRFYAFSIVVVIAGSTLNAQIRTPIATVSGTTATVGAAPYNATALATSPTSIAVSWSSVSGTRGYTVDRSRTDDPACCVAHSGLITTPSWTDGSLESGQQYSFVITALYSDGRQGSTEVVAATPMPSLQTVRLPRGAEVTSAEGSLRLTACGQKSSGGPGPTSIIAQQGTPAGARFYWQPVPGDGMNYVVDRAPEGTTTWTLVGSTCGGPSPIYTGGGGVHIRDLAGGVTPLSRYVYRITAISSNGAAGWNSYHWTAPCWALSAPTATVSGSTVTLNWSNGSSCGGDPSLGPDTFTITSDFGYTKVKSYVSTFSDTIYGVPLGTHTFTIVGGFRTGGSTAPVSVSATVAY